MTILTSFADSLYSNGDYYRAITEYKRLLQGGLTDSAPVYYKISSCYYNSQRYKPALEFYSKAMQIADNDTVLQDTLVKFSYLLLRSGYLGQVRVVLDGVNTPEADKILALSYFYEYRWEDGACFVPDFHGLAPGKVLFCSALLPGSGQMITGHVKEGIISCILNVGLGYLSYQQAQKHDWLNFSVLFSQFLRFYQGNLVATQEFVVKENMRRVSELEKAWGLFF